MSMRFNVIISDELVSQIDKIAESSESTKSEVLRKAIQLYVAAKKGTEDGLKLGLVNSDSKQIVTEFIGL